MKNSKFENRLALFFVYLPLIVLLIYFIISSSLTLYYHEPIFIWGKWITPRYIHFYKNPYFNNIYQYYITWIIKIVLNLIFLLLIVLEVKKGKF